ncbi:hypothetical protein BJX61DRAFT_520612 [Aspergillus egyptiacus]|nr:hypothetical protein BJX61DRAFT_520612 [Aspergillus egyptiacus]
MPSTSLLDLPLELRNLIITHVLYAHRPAPAKPTTTNRTNYRDIAYRSWACRAYSEQHDTHSPSNCLALLLTCRQLSIETQALLDLPSASSEYHLDIAYVNEFNLYPTWICVPRLTTHVPKLHVSVRLLGHMVSPEEARLQGGDGGETRFPWTFYALLERFLAYGPVGEKKGKEIPRYDWKGPFYMDRNVTIGTLILNITSAETELPFPPADRDFMWWFLAQRVSSRYKNPENVQYKPRPEWIVQHLGTHIGALLWMTERVRGELAQIMYERIGAIRILIEGESYREWELPETLAEIRRTREVDSLPDWMRGE